MPDIIGGGTGIDASQQNALHLTLILGGVRAGKSADALNLAAHHASRVQSSNVLFVATAQAFDAEMERRIQQHRAERPEQWETLEEPVNLSGALRQWLQQPDCNISVVVIDCLTLWVSNLLLATSTMPDEVDMEGMVAAQVQELLSTMSQFSGVHTAAGPAVREWIVVSNEVGLGVVPPTVLGRQFRDALGRANQLVAAAANRVTLMVAGLHMTLKPGSNQHPYHRTLSSPS